MKKIRLLKGQTLVFDGDSLTAHRSKPTLDQWPWLRLSNSHRSWADVFSELLFAWHPELNLKFRTAAVGGSICHDLIERFETTIAVIKPNWVFMTLGTNDAARNIPPEAFDHCLRDYAQRIAVWGGQMVFLYGLKPCPLASSLANQKMEKRLVYDGLQKKIVAELPNVHLIDIGKGLLEKSALLYQQSEFHNVYSDGTHFSHLGATIIAGEVYSACCYKPE
jgi:lysophospholipase L1-like esterase